jgi:hypothetical protein
VREAALWASSYEPQPPYRTFIEEVRDRDPDEDLRDSAELLPRSFDDAGVGTP